MSRRLDASTEQFPMGGDLRAALEQLGFTERQLRVYAALLSAGWLSAGEIAAKARVSRGRVYEVIDALVDQGFVVTEEGLPRRFGACPADIAVPSYLRRLDRDITTRKKALARLLPQLAIAPTPPPSAPLCVLATEEEVAQMQMQMYEKAQRSIAYFCRGTVLASRKPAQVQGSLWYDAVVAANERCSSSRLLADRHRLRRAALRDRVQRNVEIGTEVRVGDAVPIHAIIIDGRHVLMDLSSGRSDRLVPQLYVKHAQLGAALLRLFDAEWAQARPFTRSA